MSRGRTRILFDTDPGIDDAMALLMLARDARAELVGISTVFGNASVDTTTANALALCHRFGIDVPVARGAAGRCCARRGTFRWRSTATTAWATWRRTRRTARMPEPARRRSSSATWRAATAAS